MVVGNGFGPVVLFFFFSSRRRHTRYWRDWSSDVCSSDLLIAFQIWNAIRFGTVMENVVVKNGTREPDFSDDTLTENTRAAYPLEFIPNSLIPSLAGHPKVIIFLTADAFGVMPPIARLNKESAMYDFMSGFTRKL